MSDDHPLPPPPPTVRIKDHPAIILAVTVAEVRHLIEMCEKIEEIPTLSNLASLVGGLWGSSLLALVGLAGQQRPWNWDHPALWSMSGGLTLGFGVFVWQDVGHARKRGEVVKDLKQKLQGVREQLERLVSDI